MPKYHLAVVGGGIGGLAAAALAARQGKSTIVLEPGDAAGGVLGSRKSDGFVFSPGPHLSFGFERDGAIQALGESLGIALHASLCSPCYQVALPDRRITIYAEHSETLDELSREFPREIDRIAKFYRDLRTLSARGAKSRLSAFFSRRRTAGGFIKRYRFSREFSIFLDVQSLFFFRRRAADISLSLLIMLCDSAPFAVSDGFNNLTQQLIDVILKNHGEIQYEVPLSEIALQKGRRTGLSTPQGSLEVDTVLLNTESPGETRGEVIFIGSRNDVVPVGMEQNVLCVADYDQQDDFFTLSLSAKDDESAAPKGMRAMTASFPRAGDRTKEELMLLVGTIMPFLSEFVVLAGKHRPSPRIFRYPEGMSLKTIRTVNGPVVPGRFSAGNIYMLGDGSGTPAQEVAASQAFMARLK